MDINPKERARPTRIGASAASPTYTLSGPTSQLAALSRWVNAVSGLAARRTEHHAPRAPSDIALTAREVLNELKKDLHFGWLHQFITSYIWEAAEDPPSVAAQQQQHQQQLAAFAAGLNRSSAALQPLPISSSLCYSVLSVIAPYVPPVEIYTVVSLLERIEHARKVVSGCHSSLKTAGGAPSSILHPAAANAHTSFSAPATPASQQQRDGSITFTVDPLSESSDDDDGDGCHHHHHHMHDANADIAFADLGWTILTWIGRRCGSVEDVVTICRPFVFEAATALLKYQTMCEQDQFHPTASCVCATAASGAHHPQHIRSLSIQAAGGDLGDHLAEALANWIGDRMTVRAMSTFHAAESDNTSPKTAAVVVPAITTAATTATSQEFGDSLRTPPPELITPIRPVSHGANECVTMGEWAASPLKQQQQQQPAPEETSASCQSFFEYDISDSIVSFNSTRKKQQHEEEVIANELENEKEKVAVQKAIGIATVFLCIIFRSHVPHSTRIAELAKEDDEIQEGGRGLVGPAPPMPMCRVLELALGTVLRVASISDVGKFTNIPLLRQDLAEHFAFPATIAPNEALRSPPSGRDVSLPAGGLNEPKFSSSSIDEVFLQSFTVRNTSIVVEMLQTPRNFSLFTPPAIAGHPTSPILQMASHRPPAATAASSPVHVEPPTSRAPAAADRYRITVELDGDDGELSAHRSRTSTEVGAVVASAGQSPVSQTAPKRRRRKNRSDLVSGSQQPDGGEMNDFSEDSGDEGNGGDVMARRRQQPGGASCGCCSVM